MINKVVRKPPRVLTCPITTPNPGQIRPDLNLDLIDQSREKTFPLEMKLTSEHDRA
jgi:hypothetical protein